MPKKQVITEFLATISPSYNISQWESAGNNIGNKLNTVLGKVFLQGTKRQIKELEKRFEQLNKKRDLMKKKKKKTSSERDSLLSQISAIDRDKKLSDEEKAERKLPLQDKLGNVESILSKQRNAQKGVLGELSETSTALDNANLKVANFGKGLTQSAGYMAIFVQAVKAAWEAAQKIAEEAVEFSNQFISQSSMFVDEDIRDLMAKFGISSEQAQSMNYASNALGIDLEDYSKLTEGQRKLFAELMQEYQEGLDSIDDQKLQRFNESVQEYQETTTKFQMKLQLSLYKILAESDAVPELLDTIGETLESITNIISSDAFQTAADIILGIINGILEFATAPLNFIGSLFGGNDSGSSSTTNNNSTTNNININNNNKISGQELALQLSMQLQNATTP